MGVLPGSIVRVTYGDPSVCVEGEDVSPRSCSTPLSQILESSPRKRMGGVLANASRVRERILVAATHGELQDFYELIPKPIGEGAFGVVCKARQKDAIGELCGEFRAVKTVMKKDITDADAFAREIELSRAMDHPNLIRLYHSFETSQAVYLVQELCEGGELFDRIVEAGHFSERQAAVVTRQMLLAIGYLHHIFVCHRDLKPENFLLQCKGPIEETTLKLIDFGLSRKFTPGVDMTSKVGTVCYVAPEVLSGGYGPVCDVWSCGVLMYILLSGRPPFGGRTDGEILQNVKRGRYCMEGPSWTPVSLEAKSLLKKMLQMKPDERVQAPEALLDPWLKRADAANREPSHISSDMLNNLKTWRMRNRFEKAAIVTIAGQMSDTQIESLKDVFLALDADDDGHLTLAEMRQGLQQAHLDIPDGLKEIMEDLDSAGHEGSISYTDFLAATLDRRSFARRDLCYHAFRNFDADHDGQLSLDEVARILDCALLQGLQEVRMAADVLNAADKDHDGRLSFEEFLAFVTDPGKCTP